MTDESGRVCSSCGQEPRPGVYENPDLTYCPEWGSQGGLTLVLCTPHARLEISREIREATASAPEGE